MQTVESAKQFLITRISEQAASDGIALSDIEKRMFLFSETSPNTDWEANEQFEKEFDDSEYENKIARLLRQAYASDKKNPGGERTWRESLETLSKEDFYGLVMVDLAKIPRHVYYFPRRVDYLSFVSPQLVLFIICELIIFGAALGILSNYFKLSFLSSDGLRLIIFVLLIAGGWGLGEVYRRGGPE